MIGGICGLKVIVPTGGFFPAQTYGGPAVSILNICNLLHDKINFTILTSDHELNDKKTITNIHNGWNEKYNATVFYLKNKEINYNSFLRIVEDEKPDWIYLNSLFDFKFTIPFLKIAQKKGIKVLLAPRGQLNAGAFKKKFKKIPYLFFIKGLFKRIDLKFQSTCEEETNAIKKYLYNNDNQIIYLTNIPSIPSRDYEHFKETNKANLVFFSRIHPKKNLLFALNVLKNVKEGKVNFDIYGPIEDQVYWDKCLKEIKNIPSNVQVAYKGKINHEDIFDVISQYHLFFFPTYSENYGHVIAESLGAGTPVLLSDQTPWNDVNDFMAGRAYPLDSFPLFLDFVNYIIKLDNNGFKNIVDNVNEFISKKNNLIRLKKEYLDVFFD